MPTSSESVGGGADKPVGLRDIAAEAGVSIATVSLALRGDARISADTRARVLELAERLHYRPNVLLAAVASHHFRSNREKNLVPVAYLSGLEESTYGWGRSFAAGLAEAGRKLGYLIHHYDVREGAHPARLSQVLYHRGYVGLLLGPCGQGSFLEALAVEKFTVLACGPVADAVLRQFDSIRLNTFRLAKDALQNLAAAGCRRVVVVFPRFPGCREDDELLEAACLIVSRGHSSEPVIYLRWLEGPDAAASARWPSLLSDILAETRADGLLVHPRVAPAVSHVPRTGGPVRLAVFAPGLEPSPSERPGQVDPTLVEAVLLGLDRMIRQGIKGYARAPKVTYLEMPAGPLVTV